MPPASARSQARAGQIADQLAGTSMLVVCIGVGAFVLIQSPRTLIPVWSWILLFAVCVATAFAAAAYRSSFYAVAVVTSWALVLTMADSTGAMSVVLISVAAIGTYILRMRWVAVVIAANSVVLLVSFLTFGVPLDQAVFITVFYGFIHVAVALMTYTLIKEQSLRVLLEERNVQLTAAGVMLEDSARTSERLRISRELHDLIGHQLTVLNLELEAARHRNTQGDAYACGEHIGQASAVAKELLGDVRSTVSEFRDTEASDVTDALGRMASAVPSLAVRIVVDDDVHPDDTQATTLIRAAQEIMTNTVKHSDATKLWLEVTRSDGEVRLAGHDNGTTAVSYRPGNGLLGLEERVLPLGGTLGVTPGDGFRVEVTLPEQLQMSGHSND